MAPMGSCKPAGIPYSSINLGAIGSGAYYFNKYVGGEIIYLNHPDGANDGMSSISAGPIFRAPMENFTVFAHGLVGAARLGGPNNEAPSRITSPTDGVPRWRAGGGMDYDLPFFEQPLFAASVPGGLRGSTRTTARTRPSPSGGAMGGRANMSGVELSTGIVTHFGHIIPPPPVTYSCSVSPASVYPGDPITVTGTALNLESEEDRDLYLDGGRRHDLGHYRQLRTIDTQDCSPGSYTAKGHVSEGAKPGQMADCTAQLHGEAVRAADDLLLGESFDGEPGRLVDDHCERQKPAESSSDL